MSYGYGTTPISPMDLPSEEPPERNRRLIIIIVVLVVLCCCCLGLTALGWGLWTYGDEMLGVTHRMVNLLV